MFSWYFWRYVNTVCSWNCLTVRVYVESIQKCKFSSSVAWFVAMATLLLRKPSHFFGGEIHSSRRCFGSPSHSTAKHRFEIDDWKVVWDRCQKVYKVWLSLAKRWTKMTLLLVLHFILDFRMKYGWRIELKTFIWPEKESRDPNKESAGLKRFCSTISVILQNIRSIGWTMFKNKTLWHNERLLTILLETVSQKMTKNDFTLASDVKYHFRFGISA